MKILVVRALRLVLCAWVLVPCMVPAQTVGAASEAVANRPLKVLFLGNSLTYFNNMPSTVAALAFAARNPRVLHVVQVAVPETTLEQLWSYRSTHYAVSETNWDFVVLQENPGMIFSRPERTTSAARQIDAAVKEIGAKTVFYATWVRKERSDRQDKVTQEYVRLAAELGAQVAPVGTAWQQLSRSRPEIPLFNSDALHPTPTGSYLTACVLLLSILKTDEPCPPLESDQISKLDVAAVADAAIRAVRAGR